MMERAPFIFPFLCQHVLMLIIRRVVFILSETSTYFVKAVLKW